MYIRFGLMVVFLFLLGVAGTGSGSDEIKIAAIYDVNASAEVSEEFSDHNYVATLSATASVQAESGSDGWHTVWAEAGSDRGKRSSGAYVAGRRGFSIRMEAKSTVSRSSPDWGYIYCSAYINSQDSEDWAPK